MNPEIADIREQELKEEFGRLEERIEEVAAVVRRLREEKTSLEAQCVALRSERQGVAETLGRLIDKVDALRGGI